MNGYHALVISSFIAVLMLLAACQQRQVVCPDGRVVQDASACTGTKEEVKPAALPEKPSVVEEIKKEVLLDPAVKALIDASAKVQSIRFKYAPIEVSSTGTSIGASDTYLVRGSKIRVDIPKPITFNPKKDKTTLIDTVYLDTEAQMARGFCLDREAGTCSPKGVEHDVAYDDYAIALPSSWLERIPASAFLKGACSFKSREGTQSVRFESDGSWYDYCMDKTGMPLRVSIYADEGYAKLTGGVEYQEFGVNLVREADVVPPQ